MAKRFPVNPSRPELICWGCDRYCAADAMACGNGSDRTQHPVELFGPGWDRFGLNARDEDNSDADADADADASSARQRADER
ncbi:DUF3079 domain-containing protein [Oxalobacteraceae bacterium A2-2]